MNIHLTSHHVKTEPAPKCAYVWAGTFALSLKYWAERPKHIWVEYR